MARASQPAEAVDPSVQTTESADPSARQPAPEPAPTASKKKWEFATIGYIWFAGAKGQTDVIGPVEPVDLDLNFGDVLKAFKFAFMGAAEAKHDRLVFLGDLMFIHLDTKQGIGIRDPDFLTAELDSRTAEVTFVGGYRVVDKGPVTVDILAGGRMNWFKTTLQLEGPNRSAEGSVKQSWFDPLIAGRAIAPLGGKWSANLYGDVGGFGIGSDITWQMVPTINYRLSHKLTLGAGWRVFKVHYDKGDFLYDVAQSGPVIVFRTVF
jgi:hypothetical protein